MVSDLNDEFVQHLRLLVPHLLAPENIVTKEIGGQPMTAKDLFEMLPSFMEVFKDDLFQPASLLDVIMANETCFLHYCKIFLDFPCVCRELSFDGEMKGTAILLLPVRHFNMSLSHGILF